MYKVKLSECRLNETWGKGYQRKGTALYYLNKQAEAIEAYK
jgi:hypothetical protein